MDRLLCHCFLTGLALLWSLFPGAIACRSAEEADMRYRMTAAHNRIRHRLGIPPLRWSEELARHARKRAIFLATANGCRLRHEADGRYGENLYWASSVRWSNGRREIQHIGPEQVVSSWGSEEQYFDHQRKKCRPNSTCGHYTQIIWRATTHLGCDRAICADNGQIWVCLYDPPGNYLGQPSY